MNKEMFLKELSDRLQILNEKERNDLLEEYAQHIDMKIASGLTEEDAVKDFGTLEELCAELLDVYHINSEYATGSAAAQGMKKKLFDGISIPGLKKDAEASEEKTEEQKAQELEERRLKEEAKLAKKVERREQSEQWRMECEARRSRRREKRKALYEAYKQKRLERKASKVARGGTWFGRLCRGTWNAAVSLILLCWKICLFCAAAPVIFLSLFALFGTGMTAVLILQGYPLVGITFIGGGIFLASAGLSGLILSYVFSGKKQDEKKGE